MLFRMIVYAVVFYVVWKILQSVTARMQRPPGTGRPTGNAPKDFSNIQDAEFEDLTKKESADKKPDK